MDYINAGILDNINFLKRKNSPNIYSTLVQYYRMLFEYHLTLMFACLWDRKEYQISIEKRQEIVKAMAKPQLGTTLNFIMYMNKVGEPVFDLSGGYEKMFRDDFIYLRNQNFGHKIIIPNVQEESYKELCNDLEKIFKKLVAFEQKFWGDNCEFLLRQDPVEQAQIIIFQPNRFPKYIDVEKSIAAEYTQNALYFHCDTAGYFKVSPFLLSEERNGVNYDFYYFRGYKIESGKFYYSRVSEINDVHPEPKTFPEFFTAYRQVSKHTIQRANGVLSNKFENNYDYFINIAPFTKYVTQIWDFLIKNQSNTCLTIRGSGGVGKTALVHYICTKYLFESNGTPSFNYVIFCSAKDREYKLNAMTEHGQIYLIDKEKIIDSYSEILRTACRVLAINLEPDTQENIAEIEEKILQESGVLFIIDDFETLTDAEKEKVVNLINRMQISRHKVLITTRSQYMIGSTYDIERMNEEQVISFMKERFKNIPNPDSNIEQFKELLAQKGTREKIYNVTMGLPLLTIQLASLMPLKGFTEKLLSKKFSEDAEDFLLGRLYSYFSTPTSKLLFLLIAFFVKYDLQNIPLTELKIFYDLHCRRFNISGVDFENDLKELKRWNVIQIEDDSIPVSNHISYKIFERCIQKFFSEYPDKNFFDERLFKFVAKDGINKGVANYFELPDIIADDVLTDVFALENVCKFTNAERLQLIRNLLEKFAATGEEEQIKDLYSRGKKYFDADKEYDWLFEEYGIAPSVENKRTLPLKLNYFELLNKKLTSIQERSFALMKEKHNKSRSYILEKIQELREELVRLCKNDLKEALDNFSPEDYFLAQASLDLIDELSTIKALDCRRHENYKRLSELLESSVQ